MKNIGFPIHWNVKYWIVHCWHTILLKPDIEKYQSSSQILNRTEMHLLQTQYTFLLIPIWIRFRFSYKSYISTLSSVRFWMSRPKYQLTVRRKVRNALSLQRAVNAPVSIRYKLLKLFMVRDRFRGLKINKAYSCYYKGNNEQFAENFPYQRREQCVVKAKWSVKFSEKCVPWRVMNRSTLIYLYYDS